MVERESLVGRVINHLDLYTNIDITEDTDWIRRIVIETLAVVRAEVEELDTAALLLYGNDTFQYRRDVLALLGGGGK